MLTHREEFSRVLQQGRATSNHLLVLRYARNQFGETRFGYAINKQVGTAVTRNRVRRRLRELVRKLTVGLGWDIVISARRASAAATFQELEASLRELTKRSGLLEQPGVQKESNA
jgi:ribonuclease P protein component